MKIRIRKGLDVPIRGRPEPLVEEANAVSTVAVLGTDYHGLQPGMAVQVDDRVRLGQTLFIDKKNPGVRFTAQERDRRRM